MARPYICPFITVMRLTCPSTALELTIPRGYRILGALGDLWSAGFLARAATLERVLVQVILDPVRE